LVTGSEENPANCFVQKQSHNLMYDKVQTKYYYKEVSDLKSLSTNLFFVDGSNRAGVNLLKVAFDESLQWEPNSVNPELMKIIPVTFKQNIKNVKSFTRHGKQRLPNYS
jgi:hypothetical protein